jgi:hypothetical protein
MVSWTRRDGSKPFGMVSEILVDQSANPPTSLIVVAVTELAGEWTTRWTTLDPQRIKLTVLSPALMFDDIKPRLDPPGSSK